MISLYSQKRSSYKEKEITGFKEETSGSIISSLQYISLDEKTNISLTISLSHYSSKEQTISLSLDNTYCLINKTELTFSSSHKQEEVVISASHLNTDFEDHISKLTLSSEGTEDKTIQIQINNIDELTYSDISISEESLVLKENQAQILYISLKDKPVINQTVTLTINNNYCSINDDSLVFTPDNYSSSQEVKVVSNIKGEDIETQTSIISLSSGTVRKSISVSYEKPSTIKEEILTPFVSGFIIQPVNYYTAYYDVDYTIQNMQVKFNNDEWRSLDLNYDSFTNNACMIEIPYKYQGTKPTIQLKAFYKDKVKKVEGTPAFTLEGYHIKASYGDYVEYFNPSSTIPKAVLSSSDTYDVSNYLHFTKVTSGNTEENFYLALREKSSSVFEVNGYSPTNFEKVFMASQDRNKQYYLPPISYYGRDNDITSIKFIDGTDTSKENYSTWKNILKDAIDTFNSSLKYEGFNVHIEETTDTSCNNIVMYGTVPNDYGGLCDYNSSSKSFTLHVSDNPNTLRTYNSIKSVLNHELGHLLGFNDSPYAIDDSLYSYARDLSTVTYYQPNDLATLKSWNLYKGR